MKPKTRTSPLIRRSLALVAATAASVWAAPPAVAADSVYWANQSSSSISFAALNSTVAGDIPTTADQPDGLGIDPVTGKIYWSELSPDRIVSSSLDGGPAPSLTTTGATLSGPGGVNVDSASGRIYWPNVTADKISFANLSGSGGGDINTTGATLANPTGVAVDPAAGRIYWSSAGGGGNISFANLDGTGGANLTTTNANVNAPIGVAVDPAAGRIYWANAGNSTISYANLDGTGGGNLNTTGATVSTPNGVAIDAAAGRIYWGNYGPSGVGTKVSYARLDGSGGADLPTLTATVNGPSWPTLLKSPVATGPPVVSGGSAPGADLNCSKGSWAPDLSVSQLYRAPSTFAYQWLRDGTVVAGATSDTITAEEAGGYTCRVTATNHAGPTSQTSAPLTVIDNTFTFGKTKVNEKNGTATISIVVPGPGALSLSGKNVAPQRQPALARAVRAKPVKGAGTVKLTVKAKGKAKKKLKAKGKLKVKVTITFTPTGGTSTSQTKAVKLKLKG